MNSHSKNFNLHMQQKLLNVAKTAAHRAGKMLVEKAQEKRDIAQKSGPTDLVTQFDHASQDIIVKSIHEKFPAHSILAEEEVEIDKEDTRWIVDPIDGTTNFVYNYPLFCVSIAVEQKGEITVGVVYLPVLEETFWGVKGEGAWLNGKNIGVSETATFDNALLCTGFPYDKTLLPQAVETFSRLTRKTRGIRRDGAAAIDLAFVAMGRVDGFWELDLSPWDVAAGSLIVEEAGGKVSDYQGKEHDIFSSSGIVASNGLIHSEFVSRL